MRTYVLTPGKSLLLALLVLSWAAASAALAQDDNRSRLNASHDPWSDAGLCYNGPSAIGPKWVLPYTVGETATNVLALQVLACKRFTAGSGVTKVDCAKYSSSNVPYAYCAYTPNDGLGNEIAMGVLKRDATTEVNGNYTGCPSGATLRPKLEVARAAGVDPRTINGIVTISCARATGASRSQAIDTACGTGRVPYDRCVSTANDGFGNAVTLGIVRANGPGDPYAVFGECDGWRQSVSPGFTVKADVLPLVGKTIDPVRSIDVTYCSPGGSGTPSYQVVSCASIATFPTIMSSRYDYCIVGSDAHGNYLTLGVSGR